jgi:hypothetical protein
MVEEAPYYVDDRELHRRINPKLTWEQFCAAIKVLDARGFPKPDPRLAGRYWRAVVRWFNIDNGLTPDGRMPAKAPPELASSILTPRQGYVYFAKLGTRIKIGFTTNWATRRRSMQTDTPDNIALLALVEGDRQLEGDLHRRFAHLRGRGEWFEETPELLEFILGLGEGVHNA